MDDLVNFLVSPEIRLLLLGAYVALGLVISVQIAQTQSDEPWAWTKITPENRPIWATVYVLEAWLIVQNSYPKLRQIMQPYAAGYEDKILNAVWMGLLGLEIVMVMSVAAQGLVKRLGLKKDKQKAA